MRGARAARVVFRKTPVIAKRSEGSGDYPPRHGGAECRLVAQSSTPSYRSERLRDVLDILLSLSVDPVPASRVQARWQRKVYPCVIPTTYITYITYSRNQHQPCQLDSSSSLLLRVSFLSVGEKRSGPLLSHPHPHPHPRRAVSYRVQRRDFIPDTRRGRLLDF